MYDFTNNLILNIKINIRFWKTIHFKNLLISSILLNKSFFVYLNKRMIDCFLSSYFCFYF